MVMVIYVIYIYMCVYIYIVNILNGVRSDHKWGDLLTSITGISGPKLCLVASSPDSWQNNTGYSTQHRIFNYLDGPWSWLSS